ncbi:hypothetical protein K458DRAFT_64534 [Lentithecium fluviatile CBS 122367]|uniref:Uncharacterized protein n=1 Tax=Lentithecium fluviatile CBS 122367 TaxID=1168545 RepID=A0A6G1JLD4_9PLEO|nr:hypothetical protein K458DRAFT_64534 [Lentithecium fluviatile CBS 122367]
MSTSDSEIPSSPPVSPSAVIQPFSPAQPPPQQLVYSLMHHRTTALEPGKLRGNAITVYAELRAAVNKVKEIKAQHANAQLVGTSSLQFADDARVYRLEPAQRPFELLKYSERGLEGRIWNHYWWIETVGYVSSGQTEKSNTYGMGSTAKVMESGSMRNEETRPPRLPSPILDDDILEEDEDEDAQREAEFLRSLGK